LHELIAGDVPFIGETFPEVLVKVMSAEPPRLGVLHPGVPEGLEDVVRRCLEKDPGDRFSSVAALGVALAPYASPRTLGLQARLKSSLSQPPAAPAKLLEVTRAGAEAPPQVLPLPTGSAPGSDALPNKTNTAWGGQSGAGTRADTSRRRRYIAIAASTLVVAGVGLALSFGSGGPAPGAAPVAPAAAPLPRPAEPPPPVAPTITPASGTVGAEPKVAGPKVAPALDTTAPAAAADSARKVLPPAVAEEPAPGTPQPPKAPVSAGAAARTPAHRGVAAKAGATARAGTSAPRPARSKASEPAPAPKAAAAKARVKPLSIEFK
jgi:serine/threonine-protein kinase